MQAFATQSAGQSAVRCRHCCLCLRQRVVTDLLCCFVSPSTETGDRGCQEGMAVSEGKDFRQVPGLFLHAVIWSTGGPC